jgi:glycine cleavage system protein P-like pyridoxal-binding family
MRVSFFQVMDLKLYAKGLPYITANTRALLITATDLNDKKTIKHTLKGYCDAIYEIAASELKQQQDQRASVPVKKSQQGQRASVPVKNKQKPAPSRVPHVGVGGGSSHSHSHLG